MDTWSKIIERIRYEMAPFVFKSIYNNKLHNIQENKENKNFLSL